MPLWTPANLAVAPKAWMRAAADQSLVIDHDGKLVAVPPHAGTIVSFSTSSGYRPSVGTLNGIRAVSIPTMRVPLWIDDFNIGRNIGALALFVVAKAGGLSVDWQNIIDIMVGTPGSGANRAGLYIRSNGLLEAGGRRLDGDPYQYHQHSVPVGTNAAVVSGLFSYAGATLQAGVNGVYESRGGGFQTPGNTSDTPSVSAAIGASSTTTGYYMESGLIGEAIVLQYIPTTDERQRIEGYLAHQWGLSASLPSGHPYRSLAPGAGGLLSISGFVKLDGDEAQARVLLLESETGELRAIAQSDPVSGYYTFEDVTGEVMAPGEDYFLLCDYGNGVRPLAHGPITPLVA